MRNLGLYRLQGFLVLLGKVDVRNGGDVDPISVHSPDSFSLDSYLLPDQTDRHLCACRQRFKQIQQWPRSRVSEVTGASLSKVIW